MITVASVALFSTLVAFFYTLFARNSELGITREAALLNAVPVSGLIVFLGLTNLAMMGII